MVLKTRAPPRPPLRVVVVGGGFDLELETGAHAGRRGAARVRITKEVGNCVVGGVVSLYVQLALGARGPDPQRAGEKVSACRGP
jgi:hypothetical protein